MAEALYLVTKSDADHNQTVNGIRAVLINCDDGQTDTQIKAAAMTAASGSYTGADVDSSFRDAYFDTVVKVSDLTSGPLKDNLDAYVFAEGTVPRKVEG